MVRDNVMTEQEAIDIAIHCLGVQAEQEVCEECHLYAEGGITCREVARTAISALKEIQQYREIGTVEEVRVAYKSGYDVGYIKGYDDGYALGITQPI